MGPESALHAIVAAHCKASSRAVADDTGTDDVESVVKLALTGECLDINSIAAAAAVLRASEEKLEERLAMLRAEAAAATARALPTLRACGNRMKATGDALDALSRDLDAMTRHGAASTSAVRMSHEACTRVTEARLLVDELLSLEERAGVIEEALSRGDFAAAVSSVAPLVHAIDVASAEVSADDGAKAPPASAGKPMHETERAAKVLGALRQRVSEELMRSAHDVSSDAQAVCKLVRLMGPLDSAAEGRHALLSYCQRQLDVACAEAASSPDDPSSPSGETTVSAVPATLGQLLQRCATLLDAADQALDELLGGQAAQRELAIALRARCIEHATQLGSRFNTASGLRAASEDAAMWLQVGLADSGSSLSDKRDEFGSSASSCEPTLERLCAMLRGVTQWDAYMHGRAGEDSVAAGESLRYSAPFSEMARATVTLGHFWAASAVARAIRTHAASHSTANSSGVTLSAAAATASVASAGAAMESELGPENGNSGMSELVDSVFYVLQTAIHRAAHTCDGGIAIASVKHASALLQRALLPHLQLQMKETVSAKLAGAAFASAHKITASATDSALAEALAVGSSLADAAGQQLGHIVSQAGGMSRQAGLIYALSALQMCVGYTPRLWTHARDSFRLSLSPTVLGSTKTALEDAAAITRAFEAARDSAVSQLCRGMVMRLRARLDVFGTASYTLATESAFAAAEVVLPALCLSMPLVAPLRPSCTHRPSGHAVSFCALVSSHCRFACAHMYRVTRLCLGWSSSWRRSPNPSHRHWLRRHVTQCYTTLSNRSSNG